MFSFLKGFASAIFFIKPKIDRRNYCQAYEAQIGIALQRDWLNIYSSIISTEKKYNQNAK